MTGPDLPPPDLLDIPGLGADGLAAVLDLAERRDLGRPLEGAGVALLFEKPSLRTRNSMEMAAASLGGHPVHIAREEVGLGGRETAADIARALACYHRVIAARVFDHRVLETMAAATDAPVVNMLSDRAHPLQALADLLTLRQLFGALRGLRVAYVGDANNVCRSLAAACALAGVELAIASPEGHGLEPETIAGLPGVRQLADPAEAVRGARAVYTDIWTSMGQEEQASHRRELFRAYQVDGALMTRAADDAWFLHCLPAHRGEEVAAAVIDGPRSAVWRQAENRMWSARGALAWIAAGGR